MAPDEIAYGSIISLKSMQSGGCLLHSHSHLYPDELLGQQQVTTYCFKDDNNKWLVKYPYDQSHEELANGPITHVRSGDRIRLEHIATKRNLHSHPFPAFLRPDDQQVTGYGEDGMGDENDEWVITLVDGAVGDKIGRVNVPIRLLHQTPGAARQCALSTQNKALPEWAHEQVSRRIYLLLFLLTWSNSERGFVQV